MATFTRRFSTLPAIGDDLETTLEVLEAHGIPIPPGTTAANLVARLGQVCLMLKAREGGSQNDLESTLSANQKRGWRRKDPPNKGAGAPPTYMASNFSLLEKIKKEQKAILEHMAKVAGGRA
jgi:hypothetical protein